MTLKSYLAGRRLCYVALALRDSKDRIIDIALRYGFSSQEALTRAFVKSYGCTPYAYRMNPKPIKLSVKQTVLFPDKKLFGGIEMDNMICKKNINIKAHPTGYYYNIPNRA